MRSNVPAVQQQYQQERLRLRSQGAEKMKALQRGAQSQFPSLLKLAHQATHNPFVRQALRLALSRMGPPLQGRK